MQCFLCNENNFALQYSLKNKDILCCKNDRLFFVGNADIPSLPYGKEYFSNVPNVLNKSYFLSKLRKIQKLTAKSKPAILDVGCGWGDFEEERLIPCFLAPVGVLASLRTSQVAQNRYLMSSKT